MMSKDEFDKLAADQKKLIVESSSLPDTNSLNPASALPPHPPPHLPPPPSPPPPPPPPSSITSGLRPTLP